MSVPEITNQGLSAAEQAEIDAFMAGPEIRQWDKRIEDKRELAQKGISHLIEVDGVIVTQEAVDAEREVDRQVNPARPHDSN